MTIPTPRKRMTFTTATAGLIAFQKQLGLELTDNRLLILGSVAAVYVICQTLTDIFCAKATPGA